jgi:eukaryotic-like serine/threonine-protein kinase
VDPAAWNDVTSAAERLRSALADRYRLGNEVGRGGMAEVYIAEDLKHRRQVAIKVLKPELAAAIGAERFLREIQTTAALRHPHILPLYDSGRVDDLLYYVMPYVEGESLRERLRREKQLSVSEALTIAAEVADALTYAHARGVVHRDIKPENILLDSGHAVVADFGIARAMSVAGAERLTATGLSIGTPQYMSPEQAAGERDLDGRSDLYSLGCVLYEMLAGQPPFVGPSQESIIHQHLTAPPPPVTQLRPSVPRDVADLVDRALAKMPADRISPAESFSSTLRQTPAVQIRPRAHTRSVVVVGAAAVVIALLVAAVAIAFRRDASPPLVPGRTTQVTLEPGMELDPALSPDGSLIAYAGGRMGRMRIFVRPVTGGRALDLSGEGTGDHRNPRWSPDGTRLAYETTDGVFVVPVLGGTPTRLFPTPADYRGSLAWSPDGGNVAYAGVDRVYRHDLRTGETIELARVYQPHSLSWSPDGRRLAVVSDNSTWVFGAVWLQPNCESCSSLFFANVAPSAILTVPADGGEAREIVAATSMNMSPSWLPDGNLLFMSDRGGSRDVYWQSIDREGRVVGSPLRLTTGLSAHTMSVSTNGRIVAYSRFEPTANVWSLPIPRGRLASAAAAVQVTHGRQLIEAMAVTPDGRWLVFDSDRSGDQEIYRMQLPDGEPVALTRRPGADFIRSGTWNGRVIGGHGFRDGQRDPYLLDVDGRQEFLSDSPLQERFAVLSPDGNHVALDVDYGSDPQASRELAVMSREADGRWSAPRRMTTGGGFVPAWSPDGRKLVYVTPAAVAMLDVETGATTELVPPFRDGWVPGNVMWDPNGASVYFMARDPSARMAIWRVPSTGGTPEQLVLFDSLGHIPSRVDFAADRERIYFTLPRHEADVWIMELNRP